MKKLYEKPELEVTQLFSEDILDTSPPTVETEKEPGVDGGDMFG